MVSLGERGARFCSAAPRKRGGVFEDGTPKGESAMMKNVGALPTGPRHGDLGNADKRKEREGNGVCDTAASRAAAPMWWFGTIGGKR